MNGEAMELTLRFDRLIIHFWPRLDRVAIVNPLRNAITLSFLEFETAIRLARKRRV